MPVVSDQHAEILRHRAAIRRSDLSLPLKCLLRDNLLNPGESLFDYGCGHGDDVRHLKAIGFDCDGWDPVHRPHVPPRPADAVNLGYVLNVIEELSERAATLRDAWQLCRRVLVVAARIAVGDGAELGAEYGDGVLTRRGTFQRLYTQAELREYLEEVLGAEAVPAAPGVFYLFKDDELSQRYFAARYRRRGAAPRQRTSQRRFEEHRPLLEPLMAKIAELGRLPFADELPESPALVATFGSLKRAFALVRRVTGAEAWQTLRQERVDDLTVYLALGRFRRRPPFSSLPLDLQRDIREFFGNYTRACQSADACLFRAGDPEAIDQACQRSPIGRLSSNALFVHKSAVAALEPVLRIYEGCARAYLGEIDDANVVKLHRFSGKISYLACPEFHTTPHPAIRRTVKLSLGSRTLDCRDHSGDDDPLVLDHKQLLVCADYAGRDRFARFSEQEQRHGLLDGLIDLATQQRWESKLEQAGLHLRGHRLLRKPHRVASTPAPLPLAPDAAEGADPGTPSAPSTAAPGTTTDPADRDQAAPGESAEPPGREPTARLPARSRRFGVGKEIGGAVYVHRQYEHRLGPAVAEAKRRLPDDFRYDVVKYNRRTGSVTYIQCPGFDAETEPAVEGLLIVRADGTAQRRAVPTDPPIYHHKWLFVADDYTGFDVEQSKRRSAAWLALPDVDKSRIGRRSHWQAHVIPRLTADA